MLKGLEIREVDFSEIKQTSEIRLESDFYTIKTFSSNLYYLGKEIIDAANYNSIYGMNTEKIGYPAIRMNEFEGLFTGTPQQHAHNFTTEDFEKHKLKKDDILICRTNGNPNLVGKSALVGKDYEYVYESHLFKIRPTQEKISSATLAVFLNCKYGKAEIKRYSMQGNQANFSLAKFKEMRIPHFNKKLINKIDGLIFNSFENLEQSQKTYTQAEELLLAEVGLKDFSPSSKAINIKSFSQSFGTSGRLDAEYYQPCTEELIDFIANDKNKYCYLKDIAVAKRGNLIPKEFYSDKGKFYIRGGDFSSNTLEISENSIKISPDFQVQNEYKTQLGDIVFALIGSVGTLGLVRKNHVENFISNNIGVIQIKSKKILAEYLHLFLKSKFGKILFNKIEMRTAQPKISHHDIYEFPIPIITLEKQQQIADLVEQSFTLKTKSEQLLEIAKKAVEIAIEENEATAMTYIESEGKKYGS